MARQDGPILLFANGVLDDTGWVGPYLARAAAVIAADGGLRHLLPLGHRPDALIGDLDSLPAGVVAEEAAGRVIRHPRDKDETDLELALLYAVAQYPGHEVLILGGFGGRLDHMLANILVLAHPRLLGQPIRFVDDRESAWLLAADPPGETTIHGAHAGVVGQSQVVVGTEVEQAAAVNGHPGVHRRVERADVVVEAGGLQVVYLRL